MTNVKENNFDEKAYIKDAYQALIDRGIITAEMLMPSTVTDEMLDSFEQEYEVKLPSLLRAYLQTYCHNIEALRAAIPVDDLSCQDGDVMNQIRHMSVDEINGLDEEEQPYLELWWCGMFPLPQENPLGAFRDALEGFRGMVDCLEDDGLTEEDLKHFIPFADWQTAGALCIDTNINEENIDCNDDNTWQVCWFDHEEFHWKEKGVEYINNEGTVVGDKRFADFKSFLRLYFYGIYDEIYEMQAEEEGEEIPDKSSWCE